MTAATIIAAIIVTGLVTGSVLYTVAGTNMTASSQTKVRMQRAGALGFLASAMALVAIDLLIARPSLIGTIVLVVSEATVVSLYVSWRWFGFKGWAPFIAMTLLNGTNLVWSDWRTGHVARAETICGFALLFIAIALLLRRSDRQSDTEVHG